MPARGSKLRADARRNQARILSAARTLFAECGTDVGMDDVARRAGVGVGTVYRAFATKEVLYAAIVADHLAELTAMATDRLAHADPGAAFFDLLGRIWADAAWKRSLVAALTNAGYDIRATVQNELKALRAALARLLRRAQMAGAIRRDVSAGEVLALMAAATMAVDQTGRSRGHFFAILRDGLRPR